MIMAGYAYPSPQAVFQMQYESVRRDEVVGVLLALLLGGFGAHQFYLGRTGWGIFYLCLFWTPIPWIIAFIECFFMPARVRAYNGLQAAGLAAALGLTIPPWASYPGWVAPGAPHSYPTVSYAADPSTGLVPASSGIEGTLIACGHCGLANSAGSRFCARCGTRLEG
jgi:TM2 domain-containing membrane protein YozV